MTFYGLTLENLTLLTVREDMVSALEDLEWTLMPTKEVLDTLYEMAEYNKIADVRSRKHFLKVIFYLITVSALERS